MSTVAWVTVASYDTEWEAELVAGLLQQQGLSIRLKREAVAALYGLSIGPLSQVQLQVPAEDAGRAAAILQDLAHGGPAEPESPSRPSSGGQH